MDGFTSPVNPFPGIRSYESHEDYLFFGREKQIKELIGRLSQTRFVAVIGSSGCGKSSLIKAGLIPALVKGKYTQLGTEWELFTFRPGNEPMENLARALHAGDSDKSPEGRRLMSADEICSRLRSGGHGIGEIISQTRQQEEKHYLIYIDQFEELFRFKHQEAEEDGMNDSTRLVELILDAVTHETVSIFVILSMRTDFVDDCTEFRGLTEIINQGHYLVPRMTKEEIREVITGPVAALQGKIDPELVDRLLLEVGDDPDQLPILQHALMRTWDFWKIQRVSDEPIQDKHYDAIGTMKNALSIHAEEIFAELPSPRSREITEKLFKSLVDFGEESRSTRRPTKMDEICELTGASFEEAETVIDRFREPGRAFLMPPYHVPLAMDSTIDISHESLMRVWTRLKQWYEEELQSSQLYLRLSKSAGLYQEGKTGLWTNPELELALRWQEQNKPNVTWATRYDPAFERAVEYLAYSKKSHELEVTKKENIQKRNLQRTKRFTMILGMAALLSIFLLILALNMMFKSSANEKKALEKEKVALAESKVAAEQSQQALIQKKISEQQQQIAEQQKIITEEQKEYAIGQQKIAVEQKQEAVKQKQSADVARTQALRSRDEAETQRKEAVSQKQIADQERNKATLSEQNANRLRLIAIARSIAIQSAKMNPSESGDLPSLLAMQSYRFIKDNRGNLNDPDLYRALSSVAGNQAVLRGHTDEIRDLALAPGGKMLASCSSDGSVRIWDLNNNKGPVQTFNPGKKIHEDFRGVEWSPDGNSLLACTYSGMLYRWPAPGHQGNQDAVQAHNGAVQGMCIAGNQLLTTGDDGKINFWALNTNTLKINRSEDLKTKVTSILADNKDRAVYMSTASGKIYKLSLADEGSKASVWYTASRPVQSMAVTQDGKTLALGLSSGMLLILDAGQPGEKAVQLVGHTSAVTRLAFSKDQKHLVSASYDRTIRLWDYSDAGNPPIVIDDHDSWVYDVLFTSDGKHVVSCSADKTIRLFVTDPELLASELCDKVKRNLKREEWNQYIGSDIEYQKTCTSIKGIDN